MSFFPWPYDNTGYQGSRLYICNIEQEGAETMARLSVFCDEVERWPLLNDAIDELECVYRHVIVPHENVDLTDPLGARQTEWDPLSSFIRNLSVDVIITTPFMRGDMPTAPYLLAITRQIEKTAGRVKMIVVVEPNMQLNLNGFWDALPAWQCCAIGSVAESKERLLSAIRQAVGQRSGRYLFVDDLPEGRDFLRNVARMAGIEPTSDFCNFNDAHERLHDIRIDPPALIALDAVEKPFGYRVGVGMHRVIQATIRLSDVPIILFSKVLQGDPELLEAGRPMEEPVVLGQNTAAQIDTIIRE